MSKEAGLTDKDLKKHAREHEAMKRMGIYGGKKKRKTGRKK